MTPVRSSTPTRTGLSREIIARAALVLTDEHGLSGLSMRKLGTQLGVEAMSLYHYVDSKDDLLDAMLDHLYSEVQLPLDVSDADWEAAIRRGLRSFHRVLSRHQAALELFTSRPARSSEALDVLLWSYKRFTAVGLDVIQAQHALHFAVSFVMGHVASELGTLALLRHGEQLDGIQHEDPEAAEFFRQGRNITSGEMFDAGLEAVVAGLRMAYRLP